MAYDANLRKQFKRSAKTNLMQAFWPAMAASVLVMLPSALLSVIYNRVVNAGTAVTTTDLLLMLIYIAAMLFVVVPLQFGLWHYYTARARGQIVPISTVFICFEDMTQYKNSLKLFFALLGRSIGWVVLDVLAAVPVFAVAFLTIVNYQVPDAKTALLLVLLALLFLVVSLFVSVKIRRYDGAYIRLIDDPTLSAWQASGECAATFRQHNWELFVFDLSFILWGLLSIITLGVVGVFLEAYNAMAFVNYFDALRGHELGTPPSSFEELPE
jgi:uncharacterized membrane protein